MKCFECDETTEIKKYKAYLYEGVSLADVHLFNVEVMRCASCKNETLILPQPAKIHIAIGLAVVLQPARLSGADIKFLRRNAGFTLTEWSKRIGIAEATYSRLENSHRAVTVQTDKLIRTNFLNAMKQKYPETFHIAKHLETVLSINIEKAKDFAIAVDAGNPEETAKYLSFNSPLLTEPATSYIEARTMRCDRLITAVLVCERINKTLPLSKEPIGEILNVGYELAPAA
jgi:transcriptional regulator with XRE-family HTH domain